MSEEQIAGGVLRVLLDDGAPGQLWHIDEFCRTLGWTRVTVADAVAHLHRDGLVHRLDQFAFASRAAIRAEAVDIA